MAPIKFEDKLKEKLESRTLKPSQDAWSNLESRLDNEDKKSNTIKFWWLGIAASVLGVILVTTQFYKNTDDIKNLPTIVDVENIKNDTNKSIVPIKIDEVVTNSEVEEGPIDLTNKAEVALVPKSKTTETQNPVVKYKMKLQSEKSQNDVAFVEETKEDINANSLVKIMTNEELKIMQVVAEIKQLQTKESSVSDKEIDSLLKQAQREILKQRIYDEKIRTVSADALLQDVEVELEQSFRTKVFEALKSSYTTVKTAVAERRN